MTDEEKIANGTHEHVHYDPVEGVATVTLHTPIHDVVDGQITELRMRRPKVKDLRRMDAAKGGDIDRTMVMMQALTGKASALLDELDHADLEQLGSVLSFLRQPPPRTGRSS